MGPSSTFLSQTSVYWKVYQNITNKTYSKSTFPSLTLTTQVYSPVPFVRNLTTSVVSSKNFSRISFPQFSPLVADEVHKITQVLHFQACFLAPIEEKWLVLSDSSAPAHQKHWWFCRYLCSCQVKETFRTTSLMIYKIKYICLGSTWFVHDGYAVSFVTILLVFIQKKGHCFDKIVILLNIWKQWMYIMLGHSITHWDWRSGTNIYTW